MDNNKCIHSVFVTTGASNHSSEDREANDYYATDPKAAKLLLQIEHFDKDNEIWECACGEGHMAKVFESEGYRVRATDLIDRNFGKSGIDFKNGSRIELITLTDNTRGKKCNEVIYESGVDITDDRVRGLLQCMLVPYRCGAYESMDGRPLTDASRMIDGLRRYERYKEAAQRSEELDEFLGSFSITE